MKRKLKKQLAKVSDDARLIDVRGKRNAWGLSLELSDRGTFSAFGWRVRTGDVILGRTGDSLAVVTEAVRAMNPDDYTRGRYELLAPEVAAVVLSRPMRSGGIVGLL